MLVENAKPDPNSIVSVRPQRGIYGRYDGYTAVLGDVLVGYYLPADYPVILVILMLYL